MTVPTLEVDGLVVEYRTTDDGVVRALDGVSLRLEPGQCVAVVGESGSGKSTFALAVSALLPPAARRIAGTVRICGDDVCGATPEQLRRLHRDRVSFVFQNPVAALDPTKRIHRQLALARDGEQRGDFSALADALGAVGLPEPERVLRAYPYELSGGMAQRVGIALALQRDPRLMIADEPTAALDATLRRQVLELLVRLGTRDERSLILLTHDLHAVRRHAGAVAVMYGGRVVEYGKPADVFARPRHPYTQALLAAVPGTEERGDRLVSVPGFPPVLHGRSEDCVFAPRCPHAIDVCLAERPEHRWIDSDVVVCHRAGRDL